MLDKVAKVMIEWKLLGERFITVRFNFKYVKFIVIICYIFIEDVEEVKKMLFMISYSKLSYDVLCVLEILTFTLGTIMKVVIRLWGRTGVVILTITDLDFAICVRRRSWLFEEFYFSIKRFIR